MEKYDLHELEMPEQDENINITQESNMRDDTETEGEKEIIKEMGYLDWMIKATELESIS